MYSRPPGILIHMPRNTVRPPAVRQGKWRKGAAEVASPHDPIGWVKNATKSQPVLFSRKNESIPSLASQAKTRRSSCRAMRPGSSGTRLGSTSEGRVRRASRNPESVCSASFPCAPVPGNRWTWFGYRFSQNTPVQSIFTMGSQIPCFSR